MTQIGTDLIQAQQALEAGKLVAIPTETVYGLAANALDEAAVAKIFAAKDRPSFHPLIVHIHDLDQVAEWIEPVSDRLKRLTDTLWPGPLTILARRKPQGIPEIVTGGSAYVGLRVPQHPLTLELLRRLEFPLAAPSANRFGFVSPTTPQHVVQQLDKEVAYVLDGGPCEVGVESTIVLDPGEGPLRILRVGGVSLEMIHMLGGPVHIETSGKNNTPAVSGSLTSHYATHAPIVVGEIERLLRLYAGSHIGIISFRQFYPSIPEEQQRILSPQGILEEAAHRLFAAMRELDEMGLDVILAEVFPEKGLGRAINDRLQRAASRG